MRTLSEEIAGNSLCATLGCQKVFFSYWDLIVLISEEMVMSLGCQSELLFYIGTTAKEFATRCVIQYLMHSSWSRMQYLFILQQLPSAVIIMF